MLHSSGALKCDIVSDYLMDIVAGQCIDFDIG